jgi:O-antigen/teichoic acid export membrane protein
VWALAWGWVSESLLRAALLYAYTRHPVRPSLAAAEVRQLCYFGGGMTLGRVANYIAVTGDNFVVGRQLGAVALGLYSRAYQLMTLPMSEFSEVLNTVLFPAYSQIQNEPDRLRRTSLACISLTGMVVFPLLALLGVTAPELIIGLLGPGWAGAVLPLQILCAGGLFRAIYNLADGLAHAKGAVYDQSWRHGVYAVCVCLAAFVGCRWGLAAVAAGVVGALAIMYLLMAQLTIRLLNARWSEFLRAQLPGLLVGLAVLAMALAQTTALRAGQLPRLAILALTALTAIVTGLATSFLLPRRWHNADVLEAARELRRQAPAFAWRTLRWSRQAPARQGPERRRIGVEQNAGPCGAGRGQAP